MVTAVGTGPHVRHRFYHHPHKGSKEQRLRIASKDHRQYRPKAAIGQRLTVSGHIGSKHDTGVIVVTAQLGQIEITKGFKLETAGRASAVTYLQIVLAYSWGILLFGEYPNAISVLGAILVVLGVFSVTQRAPS